MTEIVVVDYGLGNLLSVQRGFEHCGATVSLTADPKKIRAARRVVLPGVGAFRNAMCELERLGLVDALQDVALRHIPLLGICLGMQLLMDESDEFGITAGLGLIAGRVIPIPNRTVSGEPQKVPHIGWSPMQFAIARNTWSGTLLHDNKPDDTAYFVHSFMAMPTDQTHRISDCNYGGHRIAATISRDQIVGCQFHPEKSGTVGLKILRRFLLD